MTLPVELLQRRRPADHYDAVVVGAGIGGLVCAAILARGGARVSVIDVARRPGGRVQTVAHQGYAVDLGPVAWEATGFREALEAAGVRDIVLAEIGGRDSLRAAVVEGGALRSGPVPVPIPGAVPSPSALEAVRSLYGVPPRVFAALGGLFEELARSAPEQLAEWRSKTLVEWLAERSVEPVVAGAARRIAVLLGAIDPTATVVPALAARVQCLVAASRAAFLAPADNPVAGTRSVVQAAVDALVEAGGELRLGTRVLGLDIERGRLRGVAVQREERPFLEGITADRCVLAVSEAQLASLLPPPTWAQLAPARDLAHAVLGLVWAISDPADGATGRLGGILRLVAPVAAVAGPSAPGALATPVTLFSPTSYAPRVAPPGHGLLIAHAPLPAAVSVNPGEIDRVALLVRSAVHDLLGGDGERVLWERQWLVPRAVADALVPPVLPLVVPGCEGVFLAGAAVATPGAWASGFAAAALSGRAAAERILSPPAGTG